MGRWHRFPASSAILVAAIAGLAVTSAAAPIAGASPGQPFIPAAGRLLDTRPTGSTVDERFAGQGALTAGSTTAIDVAGRAGVPVDATVVAVNVTVTEPSADGFVAVFPCGPLPRTSTVNFQRGQTVAAAAITALSVDGRLCIHSMSPAHVVVDVSGTFAGDAVVPVRNARLLDTRPGEPTGDGAFAGAGLLPADAVLQLQIGGRSGVPIDAKAVALTVTTTGSTSSGYVSVYPCGPRPLASTLNHLRGENRANSIVVPLDAVGRVCVFTLSPSHVVVDVTAYVPAGSSYSPIVPSRIADTRSDGVSVDGRCVMSGRVRGLTTLRLGVAGRAGVPASGIGAVVVNVVALGELRPGYVTAFDGAAKPPITSSGNFGVGEVVATSAVVPVAADGTIGLFVNTGVHLVVDVLGWLPGSSIPSAATGCDGSFVRPLGDIPALDGNCALRQDGTVVCWNVSVFSSLIVYGGLSEIGRVENAVEISGQCVRRANGSVVCASGGSSWAEVGFTGPAVDLSRRCVVTSDRRVECARRSDGVVVEVALAVPPSHFIAEPGFFTPPSGTVRRLKNLDGSVTEILGDESFIATRETDFAAGVPWSMVRAVSSGDCAVLEGDRVQCRGFPTTEASDVIQHGGQFVLNGSGVMDIARFDGTSGMFRPVPILPTEEVVHAEVIARHSATDLICSLSTSAALTCSIGATGADSQAFTIEGILMPE